MAQRNTFERKETVRWTFPNYWDMLAFVLVAGVFATLGWGASQMVVPYQLGEPLHISLNPSNLPYYGLRSVLRMFIGMFCSLIVTFIFGTWAAKSRRAERIIIPLIDILQSAPVLSFLALSIGAFIAMFPGSLLGPECAAIFAVFTSQAWNIILSFYQSLKTIPRPLNEAVHVFKLSAWQRFWRLEVPFSMPGLLWNCMVSMSASWFFVVASEAISIANQEITLPGIGSYIALAVTHKDVWAISYAISTMFVIILLYDQLIFRPLNAWLMRFRADSFGGADSWVITLFQRTHILRKFGPMISEVWNRFVNIPCPHREKKLSAIDAGRKSRIWGLIWGASIFLVSAMVVWIVTQIMVDHITLNDWLEVALLGLVTAARVMILVVLAGFVWVPVGVWIGLRPNVARIAQPVIQFLASFPANLFFPIVVLLIVRYHLNVQIWTSPLMILGTQWYILFNVIAGTMQLPQQLLSASKVFQIKGWLWWKKVILPGIFPYVITGAVTAAGGAWNASIIAEVAQWGNIKVEATGLGAYIANNFSVTGNFYKVALGTIMMCIYVLLINWLVWQPLYDKAEERFRLN